MIRVRLNLLSLRWLFGLILTTVCGLGVIGLGYADDGSAAVSQQSWYRTHDRRPCHQQSQDERIQAVCDLRIYQIMVESFVDGSPSFDFGIGSGPSHHRGDLEGVIKALPYIRDLGANAIWLTPVFDSGFSEDQWDWQKKRSASGYFAKDYFRIAPEVGDWATAKRLVERAHELGLYVFFDGVFGHHKASGVVPSPSGYLPVGSADHVSYPASLNFYREVATFWVEQLGIDGWRLDVADQVPLAAWREIRQATERICQERRMRGERWGSLCYMVAEIWKDESAIQKGAYGPSERPALESAFNFSVRYALVKILATQEWSEQDDASGQPVSLLAYQKELNEDTYADHAMPNSFLGNHDLLRFGDLIQRAGYPGPEHPSYWARHRAAYSFLLAQSGPITMYYNEETGDELPHYAERVWANCDNLNLCDDHVARTSGQIPGVAGDPLSNQQVALRDYIKQLIQLRSKHPALSKGTRRHLHNDEFLYADLKLYEDDKVLFVWNASTESQELLLPAGIISPSFVTLKPLLAGGSSVEPWSGYYRIKIAPLSGAFWQVADAEPYIKTTKLFVQTNATAPWLRYRLPGLKTWPMQARVMDVSEYRGYFFAEIPMGTTPAVEICLSVTANSECLPEFTGQLNDGAWFRSVKAAGWQTGYPPVGMRPKTAEIYYRSPFQNPPYIHYAPYGGDWTKPPGVAMQSTAEKGLYRFVVELGDVSHVEAAFNDGGGRWDSDDGANYKFKRGSFLLEDGQVIPYDPEL